MAPASAKPRECVLGVLPLRNLECRLHLIATYRRCPDCGGGLDGALRCNRCGLDGMPRSGPGLRP